MSFQILSPRLARLGISGTPGEIGLMLDPKMQQHRLGFRDAPRWLLTQPFSPDDAWEVSPDLSGRLLDDSDITELDRQVAAWASPSGVSRGYGLFSRLPAGQYFLVRSPRTVVATERVLLGNEMVPTPPNIRVLHDQPPVYACVVGARPDAPPTLNQPLLGLVILNYVGDSWMHGVLFFELATVAAEHASAAEELLLLIPIEGELVLDNMGFFSAEAEQQSRARWKGELAEQFATWCAAANAGE